MIGDIITVNARKYDGRVHRSWKGTSTNEHDGLISLIAEFSETHEHGELGTIHAGTISVEHFWTDRWYNVFHFHEPDGTKKAAYANVAMPAVVAGNVIDYVDLDMDVIQWPDGRVEVLDKDDFERNTIAYGYSPEVIRAAESALIELLELARGGRFPF